MSSCENVPRFGQIGAQLAANGYQPLPLHWKQKRPIPEGWQHYQFKAADARKKKFESAGVGILCGEVVGVDIDCRDTKVAAELEALAERLLGAAPRRTGQAPKVLRPYRTAVPFAKILTGGYRLLGDTPEGKAHKVEILAQGQQFVAYNLHPDTGMPYRWNGPGEPLTLPVSGLVTITESFGALLLQVSPDNAAWTTVAAMTDAVSPGAILSAAPGLQAAPIPGGVVLSVTDASANPYRYVRPLVQGGDGATAISVTGALSATGAV